MGTINNIESFIEKYISTVNKNNVISIHIGTIVSKQLFINKHRSQKINTIIRSLRSIPNVTIDPPQYIKSYCTNNTISIMYPNKVINYSYIIKDTIQLKGTHIDYTLSYIIINNKPNLNSNYNYNLIEEKEEITIHYKNYFDIILTKYSNTSYSVQLYIQKPIDKSILLENINYVLTLLQ